MRVLICGSRDWDDEEAIATIVAGLDVAHVCGPTLIHGDARGADRMAATVAHRLGWDVHAYPADWKRHGKGAGPRRNQQMIDEGKPDLVVAVTDDVNGSRGTADMVRRAHKAGIPVWTLGRVPT